MTGEEWRPVVGHEGLYEVSDRGRVRSIDGRVIVRSDGVAQRRAGRLLKASPNDTGHMVLRVQHIHVYVHTLVLEAFVGPRPAGKEACHWDGNPANNLLANLRWDTRSANQFDSVRHGTHHQVRREKCRRRHDLVEPNLIPSVSVLGRRGCLACNRAHKTVRHARERRRLVLDLQIEADKHYRQIMEVSR